MGAVFEGNLLVRPRVFARRIAGEGAGGLQSTIRQNIRFTPRAPELAMNRIRSAPPSVRRRMARAAAPIVAVALASASAQAQRGPLRGLDAYAEQAMREHEAQQKALYSNMERLRAERLAREARQKAQ